MRFIVASDHFRHTFDKDLTVIALALRTACLCCVTFCFVAATCTSIQAQSITGVVKDVKPKQAMFTVASATKTVTLKVDGRTNGSKNVGLGKTVSVIYDPETSMALVILPAKPAPAAPQPYRGKFVKVVTEGTGLDHKEAKLNALRNAIEQALGIFVDAETLVRNDELIRDDVLTYAQGDVESSKIIRAWRQGEYFHAKVEALVKVDGLKERAAKSGLKTQEIPSQAILDQIGIDARSSDDARALLAKYLDKYGAHNFVRPEILDQKKSDWKVSETTPGQLDLQVHLALKPDMPAWQTYSRSLTRILKRLKGPEYGYITPFTRRVKQSRESRQFRNSTDVYYHGGLNYKQLQYVKDERLKRSAEWSSWLFINSGFRYTAPDGAEIETRWEGFRLPNLTDPVFKEIKKRKYVIRVSLVDQAGNVFADTTHPIGAIVPLTLHPRAVASASYKRTSDPHRCDEMWIAPFLYFEEFGLGHNISTDFPVNDIRLSISKADFAKVSKVVAEIVIAP